MFDRDSFTVQEWGEIISAPTAVGALVVTADVSGPIGLVKEFKAIMNSMKEFVTANAANSPLMEALQNYMMTRPTDEEEAEMKKWAEEEKAEMAANKPQNPEEMKQLVRDRTGETLTLLRSKGATDDDINLFKQMMIAVAESVADASKEGGFMGFGGTRVSAAEESILAQIRSELGA